MITGPGISPNLDDPAAMTFATIEYFRRNGAPDDHGE
jgi:hypothetical protein